MSQAVALPPPPIGPGQSSRSPILYLVLVLIALLGLVAALELRLVNSAAGKEAAQRIRGDIRVRAEFGDDIHLPFAVGWGLGNEAQLYAHVSGKQAHGHASVVLRSIDNQWVASSLEVYNESEAHLINLSKPETPAKPEDLRVAGTLYFVPLGASSTADVDDLANWLGKEFGLPAKTLPSMTLPQEAYDAPRRQWVAEMLVQSIAARYPEVAADPEAKIVGVLDDDLYIRSYNWAYTFSYREAGKYSIISAARLDPAFYQLPPSPDIRMERLRKIAMKPVGLLYLRFKESADRQSADAIEASIEDIDRMGSLFLASDVRTRPETANVDGSPCLTFYSANVTGMDLRRPIVPCWQQGDEGEITQYQIDLAHGKFQLTRNDLYRPGPVPLVLQRMNFSSHFDEKPRAFGKSSWQNLDDTVWSADPNSIQTISIYGTLFHRITPGNGFSPQAKYRAGENSGGFTNALLRWENNGWRIDTESGQVWRYLGCGPNTRVQCYYMGLVDLAGDGIQVKREGVTGHLQQVLQRTNPNFPAAAAYDHMWTPLYEGDRIIEIDDSNGSKAHYLYDGSEYLTDVEADGHHVHYDYDDVHRITGVLEDNSALRIHYDSESRPDRVDFPSGLGYSIRYSGDAIEVNGPSAKYTVTILPTFFRIAEHN